MLYFLLYVFLEVMVSTSISSSLGGLNTFVSIIFTAFIGVAILVNFRKTLVENMAAVSFNCIDLEQFQKLNLFTLLGAIFLIVPGFLTDLLGIVMQFSALTSMLVNRYHVKSSNYKEEYRENNIKKDSDVIDVEIINDNTTLR